MPFTVAAIGTNTSTSGATVVITTSAVVPAGSLIVVAVTEKSTTGVAGTLADSATNSYSTSQSGSLAATAADGFGMVFFVGNSKSIANGGTITYTKNTSGSICAISAIVITVAVSTSFEDTASRASATGTTGTITVTSGTPSTVEDVFVGVLCDSGTSTAGGNATFTQASGWTNSTGFEAKTAGSGNARVDIGVKQEIGAKATQTYNPSLSSTAQQWILFITSFALVPEPTVFPDDLPVVRLQYASEVVSYRCG